VLKLLKCKKGITLIEVILSLTILTMVLIPLSSMFITTARVNANTKELMMSNQLAQEYMEKIKGASNIDPFVNGDLDGDGSMIYNVNKYGKDYNIKTTITSIPDEYKKTIGRELPSANLEINELNADSTIVVDVNDIYFNGVPSNAQMATLDEVVIIIRYNEQRTLTVSNTAQKTVSIYLIKDNELTNNDINVNVIEGNVVVIKDSVHNTQLDSDEALGYINWVYQITVEIYKASDDGQLMPQNKLIELKSSKRMN
jgi:type II secretory pathway pseudopilin PulG